MDFTRTDSRRELTVRLEHGDDALLVTYHRPPCGEIRRASRPWASLGGDLRFGGRGGIDALNALLDGGQERDLNMVT